MTLASTSTGGTKGNDDSALPSLSADGTKVAFQSFASNLDPTDTDGNTDIYVKDLASGKLTLASRNLAGTKANGPSRRPSLSADGTKVAFDSDATNLVAADSDNSSDVYVKDLVSGTLTLASQTLNGRGSAISYWPSLSGDGSKVAFQSYASDLNPADTDGNPDIYVKDLSSGELTVASTNTNGTKENGTHTFAASLSADGRRVAFTTDATNLDPADTNNDFDVYVKDLISGSLVLASANSSGVKGDYQSLYPSLSARGRSVAFWSLASNFDPVDTDVSGDVYVKDLTTGGLALASKRADGTKANGGNVSSTGSLSTDGSRVAFDSQATNLDPADVDTNSDVYVKELAVADSDGDGVLDTTDNCLTVANSNQADGDSDGVGNACDNCPTTANPDQADVNGDLHGDACEAAGTGNVDCNLAINSADALKDLRFAAGLSVSQSEPCLDIGLLLPSGYPMGDVNCSGGVNSVDALIILRAVAGLPVTIPPGCPAIRP